MGNLIPSIPLIPIAIIEPALFAHELDKWIEYSITMNPK